MPVFGNAHILEKSHVHGNAKFSVSCAFYNAEVYDNSRISGDARVYDNAQVFGNSQVYGNAHIWTPRSLRRSSGFENAKVHEQAEVHGNAGSGKSKSSETLTFVENLTLPKGNGKVAHILMENVKPAIQAILLTLSQFQLRCFKTSCLTQLKH